jgi:hypothetical protein
VANTRALTTSRPKLGGKYIVDVPLGRVGVELDVQPDGGVGLRVEINHQRPHPRCLGSAGQAECHRRFSGTAFLVHHGYPEHVLQEYPSVCKR